MDDTELITVWDQTMFRRGEVGGLSSWDGTESPLVKAMRERSFDVSGICRLLQQLRVADAGKTSTASNVNE